MPVGVTYLPIPIGATLTIVFVLEHLVAGSQHRRQAVSMGDAG
jgi:TRAP-type C4-dicarboxylate transport system permease small subunit